MIQPDAQIVTYITTAEITNKKSISSLHPIIANWAALADMRYHAAKDLPTDKKALAFDALEVAKAIRRDVAKGESIFVAYDQDAMIQGLALARISKDGGTVLQLASHPKNLQITGTEQNIVSGVGSALLTHIALKVLQETNKASKRSIKLDSVPTAIGFYKKMGFEVCANQPPSSNATLTKMKLSPAGLEELVKKYAIKSRRATTEPKQLKFSCP